MLRRRASRSCSQTWSRATQCDASFDHQPFAPSTHWRNKLVPRTALCRSLSTSTTSLKHAEGPPSGRWSARDSLAAASSRRAAANDAQRNRVSVPSSRGAPSRRALNDTAQKRVAAYCAAESYNLSDAARLLQSEGYTIDPCNTGLKAHVLHVRTNSATTSSTSTPSALDPLSDSHGGDIFVFSSGSIVSWNVPSGIVEDATQRLLLPAAEHPHPDRVEAEDMVYTHSPNATVSDVIGDTIILASNADPPSECPTTTSSLEHAASSFPSPASSAADDATAASSAPSSTSSPSSSSSSSAAATTTATAAIPSTFASKLSAQHRDDVPSNPALAATLTKIAFSSALARSTKLAVLEELLSAYFKSTQDIPATLSAGSRLRFTRRSLLRKTGELLSIRAQLNLYSELTDSLPDLFWDSRHELGLEQCYDTLGTALDVGVRIKVLNKRLDYASEIAAVLRETLSEKHSTGLEWLIIGLISIEVAFGIFHLWREGEEHDELVRVRHLLEKYLVREMAHDGVSRTQV